MKEGWARGWPRELGQGGIRKYPTGTQGCGLGRAAVPRPFSTMASSQHRHPGKRGGAEPGSLMMSVAMGTTLTLSALGSAPTFRDDYVTN